MFVIIKLMSNSCPQNKVEEVLNNFPPSKNFPSKILHLIRNSYQCEPQGHLTSDKFRLWTDQVTGDVWREVPWYHNVFHKPWKNIKLVHMDYDVNNNGLGSSEIIVPKSSIMSYDNNRIIEIKSIKSGSYNYRDLYVCGNFKHFKADIFPNVAYLKIVGH